MALKIPLTTAYETPPAGSIPARCCQVIDLGTQKLEFQNQIRSVRRVMIGWQLAEARSDGTLFVVTKRFTASLHEKSTLRQFLEAWRGKKFSIKEIEVFDLETLLGKPALLNIVHVQRGDVIFADVKGAAPLPKGIPEPPSVEHALLFDIDQPRTWSAIHYLPERVREIIEASPEWAERQNVYIPIQEQTQPKTGPQTAQPGIEDEDVPF